MRIKTVLRIMLFLVLASFSSTAMAQLDNTQNIFTPYTFYGVGSLNFSGTAATKTMGGIGAGLRNGTSFNIVNPASYSAASPQTMLFSFGMMGQNDYLKSGSLRSSHNAFNINDVTLQFRIAEGLGFGFAVTPYSTVGYSLSFVDNSPEFTNIGTVRYSYHGSGGIAQMKAGLGWSPVKNLSIGVNMLYYLGTLSRISETSVTPILTSSLSYRSATITDKDHVNTLNAEFGLQYNIPLRGNRALTLGAVYELKRKADFKSTRTIISNGSSTDSVSNISSHKHFDIPGKVIAGFSYRTTKLTVGVDYELQQWKGALDDLPISGTTAFKAVDSHNFRAGFEYTPNRYDIRKMMKRWTYRGGLRYGNSYFTVGDKTIDEYAVSIGFGAPLQRNSFTAVNFGAEFGQTGAFSKGMMKDSFFKVYLGFNIFATNEWFIRHKFK